MLALDLGVFHRTAHVVRVKEALGWSAVWISLGPLFTVFIYFGYERHWFGLGMGVDAMTLAPSVGDGGAIYNDGGSAAIKYLTGFVVEKSLATSEILGEWYATVVAAGVGALVVFVWWIVPFVVRNRRPPQLLT